MIKDSCYYHYHIIIIIILLPKKTWQVHVWVDLLGFILYSSQYLNLCHSLLMGRAWYLPPWIYTWSHSLFWLITYTLKWQLASSESRHGNPFVYTCTLPFCIAVRRVSFQVAPAPSAGAPEQIYLGQSCLSQSSELQGERKPSNKAQPTLSAPHPTHIGVSNNKSLLLKDPEFGVS